MTDACAGPAPAGFVGAMTSYVDCQAQTLGSGAWSALAAPGSSLAVVLTGLLTLFIAIIGFNLLLGRTMSVREGTLAFVKIGAVFALATSWPAYRTLVYDVVTTGPGQLVAEIGPRAGVIGADGTLVERLDLADRALAQLAVLGAGVAPPSPDAQVPPPPFGGFDAFALGGSRIVFLITAIASLAAVRIVTGLMLALGPFFIAFLLFDGTRALFEGWVRVLAGAALAAVGVGIALGLELALLEPWLSGVLARRMAGEALPTVATELFVITALFSILLLAALLSCAWVARAFRLPQAIQAIPAAAASWTGAPAAAAAPRERTERIEHERSRAAAVAGVMAAAGRREATSVLAAVPVSAGPERRFVDPRKSYEAGVPAPVGRSFARRSGTRVSARANRRDMGA